MSEMRCLKYREDVVGLLDGSASDRLFEHVAGCDDCRDARHELESATRRIARAGDDFAFTEPLADRLAALAEEAKAADKPKAGERTSETRMKAAGAPPALVPAAPAMSKKAIWLLVAALASVGLIAIGLSLADKRAKSPEVAATRAWHGKVAKISRSGADASGGLAAVTPSGKTELGEGAEIKAGMVLTTDGRTRARLELDDGSFVVLDRATEVAVDSSPRTLSLKDGSILTDVAHVDDAPPARIKTDAGEVKVLGTKLTVTSVANRTNVEVLRGQVEISSKSSSKAELVSAGQEGVVSRDGRIDVAPANDLAQRAAFGEQLVVSQQNDKDAAEPAASGLGELRARRPGRTDEKDHAVRLAKHAVKVRIAGAVARTEIDEEFLNDTNDELEGIYRFPLPPGAQIEKLALEVDGKLVDGEFVDKAKAAAIWRGAIRNAAPQAPKPKDEIVWVPGPWHDPALLEWVRGGRFELRIFPIPKKGSRRVIIAYTETVAPVSGVRRYVYPLPQGSSSRITIDRFSVDAQVLGHDGQSPVRARGYELGHKTEGGAEHLTAAMTSFTPSGDLAIEYALGDRKTEATAWAYADATPVPDSAKDKDPIGNDPFVAIALRPKLPRWQDARTRDQVIVVDAGRSMFGERFARAKRLAVQLAQEMDRRDRVTVLACDVKCRAMGAGFVAPGAPAAHDVDAFLTGVTPDGASDIVGAVRSASQLTGREPSRDLRVVLVSDGVATAGYRSGARVASEVSDALGDARAEVVAVPIGADADTNLLGEVARGGGGVVVPYQPGQRLEATALEILNATYGTTLRDVEVVLPDGVHDMAPAAIAPIRAGSETIVTARLRGEQVKGDVLVRGKVGGDPFEARYPIDVSSTTDRGNAFVPRLFAAARIAERERETSTDASRAELVALSRRFSVPSKLTSLLVLESEAMFKAFGIERMDHAAHWTGEVAAQGFVVGGKGGASNHQATYREANFGDPTGADEAEGRSKKADDLGGDALSASMGAGGVREGGFGAPPLRKPAIMAPPAPSPVAGAKAEEPVARRAARDGAFDSDGPALAQTPPPPRPRRGGQYMKKIYVRRASIGEATTPAVSADKIRAARDAVQAAPDERSKHKELARLLALSGQLDELGEALDRWSARDPLDSDVIMARADLAARRGSREASMRILSGALAASAMSSQDAFVLANTVARGYERVGKPEACAFYVSAAELRPTDADAVARAVSCERAQGHGKSAERWLAGLKDTQRKAVDTALAKVSSIETATGDVVVSATWDGGADLDVALLDPSARRAGVASRLKGTRVEGATSRDHETLALATSEAGAFVVEVLRSDAGTAPVSGKVTIRAFGQSRTMPFTLTGARAPVGRVDVRWESELVPLDGEPNMGFGSPFNRAAAASALAAVPVQHCSAGGEVGTGHVTVTFDVTGRVSSAVVDDGRFAGTPAGRCVQAAFFNARVPPFTGGPQRVGRSFTLGGF